MINIQYAVNCCDHIIIDFTNPELAQMTDVSMESPDFPKAPVKAKEQILAECQGWS